MEGNIIDNEVLVLKWLEFSLLLSRILSIEIYSTCSQQSSINTKKKQTHVYNNLLHATYASWYQVYGGNQGISNLTYSMRRNPCPVLLDWPRTRDKIVQAFRVKTNTTGLK